MDKKTLIAGLMVLALTLIALLFKADPELFLLIMIAYWVYLDRLEKHIGK